jgi:hypothetical protein
MNMDIKKARDIIDKSQRTKDLKLTATITQHIEMTRGTLVSYSLKKNTLPGQPVSEDERVAFIRDGAIVWARTV